VISLDLALCHRVVSSAFFHDVAGGRPPPTKRVSELWIIGGRRGGKDSIASLIAAHAAASFNGKRRTIAGITLPALRRGEKATVFTLAKDRDQARIALDYVRPYFLETPELAQLITRERARKRAGEGILCA
jgi:hypothetical protein